jgi:hypothetical protein
MEAAEMPTFGPVVSCRVPSSRIPLVCPRRRNEHKGCCFGAISCLSLATLFESPSEIPDQGSSRKQGSHSNRQQTGEELRSHSDPRFAQGGEQHRRSLVSAVGSLSRR